MGPGGDEKVVLSIGTASVENKTIEVGERASAPASRQSTAKQEPPRKVKTKAIGRTASLTEVQSLKVGLTGSWQNIAFITTGTGRLIIARATPQSS